jgi:hypothetical protein
MKPKLTMLSLLLVCSGPAFGQADGQWRKDLDLAEQKLGKCTLLYEKAGAVHVEAFKGALAKALEEQKKRVAGAKAIKDKAEDIITDLAGIVTISKEDKEGLKSVMVGMCDFGAKPFFDAEGQTICLLTKSTCKDYLVRGGVIPSMRYIKESGEVESLTWIWFTTTRPAAGRETMIPVIFLPLPDPNKPVDPNDFEFLSGVEKFIRSAQPSVLHEAAELAILVRLRPGDPYFRWFSDGFANVIAEHLAKKHLDKAAAKEFAGLIQDSRQYADLEKELNLRYWPGVDFSLGIPLDSEKRLEQARYAYATLEARRLVEAHGLGCLDKILDKACKADRNGSGELFAAIKAVTGEDMEARLARYQKFKDRKEAFDAYLNQFKLMMEEKDYAKSLPPLLRSVELGGDFFDYSIAINLLYILKEDAAADAALEKVFNKMTGQNDPQARLKFTKAFVRSAAWQYAVHAKAYDIAEEVLKQDPQDTAALMIRAYRLDSEGRKDEANNVRNRIYKLETQPATTMPSN